MLVLGRKESESIIIGDNIRVTIVGRSGSSIRLGVEAPNDVRIVRAEIADGHGRGAPSPSGRPRCTPRRDAAPPAQPESEVILAVLPTLSLPPQPAG